MSIELRRPPQTEERKEWAEWFTKVWYLLDQWNLFLNDVPVQKPGYERSDGTTVKVPASSAAPVYFKINGIIHKVESDLTCDLDSSQLVGGSWAADTAYYLYAVISAGAVALVADEADPSSGPTGYDEGEWTYIGAMSSDQASATLQAFTASGGIYIGDDEVNALTLTNPANGSYDTGSTFSSFPTTATAMYLQIGATAEIGASIQVAGVSSGNDALRCICDVAANYQFAYGWIPIFEADGKVYYQIGGASGTADFYIQYQGFRENPSRWP